MADPQAAANAGDSVAAQLAAEKEAAREERRKAREARRAMRRAAREKMRADVTRRIGLRDADTDPKKLVLQRRRCVWRDESGMGNRLLDVLEQQRYAEAKAAAMGKAMNVVKRRSFIPATKLCGLVGYWLGLFFQQTRLFHKAVAARKIRRDVQVE